MPQIVTTIAGNGTRNYTGDGGPAIYATTGDATGIAVDKAGNIFFVDADNAVIRRIDAATGIISTIAGTGVPGYSGDGGLAVNAQFSNWMGGLAIDSLGNIYLADGNNCRIRKIEKSTGIITTIAGTGQYGYSGDGGLAIDAKFQLVDGIELDASGRNLYSTGGYDCRVRKIDLTTGIITTVAGIGYLGYNGDEIPAKQAQVGYVWDISTDKNGDLYIGDYSNHRIRKVTMSDGKIHTVAGSGIAGFSGDGGPANLAALTPLFGIDLDSADNILFVDESSRIRKVDQKNNIISTIAGTGNSWYDGDGLLATDASIGIPWGFTTDIAGNVYFATSEEPRVCKITMDSFLLNQVHGYSYYDLNRNGQKDSNEVFFTTGKIILKKNNDSTVTMSTHGNFRMGVDTGNFSAYFIPPNNYYIPVPAIHSFSFTSYGQDDSVFFALQPVAGQRDIFVSMFSVTGAAVPGFGVNYNINYQNAGTDTVGNGYVQLVKDSRLDFVSSTPPDDFIHGDTIRWNYSNLSPLDTASIHARFDLPPGNASIGDTLRSIATINPIETDVTPANDSSAVVQPVRSSFDPNDKSENHAGTVVQSKIAGGEWLVYTIRFQNTGNAPAINITVKDTLDKKLDWNSLQMLTASHGCQLNISGNNCTWTFSHIMLPDSTANEPGSHGYIVYRIKANTNLKVEDVIRNTASIYFDYNAPVQTNTEKTRVTGDVVLPLRLLSFTAGHSGNVNLLAWATAQEINTDRFDIQRSGNGREFASIATIKTYNNGKTENEYHYTDLSPLKQSNYYRLKLVDKDGKSGYSPVRWLRYDGAMLLLYPNPVKDMLRIGLPAAGEKLKAQIVDMNGVVIMNFLAEPGAAVNVAQLKSGLYAVRIETNGGWVSSNFVKE
ncbi:MAG TPA: T9SS type A sorting domain-containing protein [Panacibacter sp.]|nr:T9SS type A sorting domain-containing protein [Panacibacter sp.]HNP43936.1 T9SS type A sorting domain-containing protein [Panacibacter sp.]